MSSVVLEVILFIVGLICLVKGGDWFVDGSCGIAHRFNMPEILIGATVVSIGTTIPEVMVSATLLKLEEESKNYNERYGLTETRLTEFLYMYDL